MKNRSGHWEKRFTLLLDGMRNIEAQRKAAAMAIKKPRNINVARQGRIKRDTSGQAGFSSAGGHEDAGDRQDAKDGHAGGLGDFKSLEVINSKILRQ